MERLLLCGLVGLHVAFAALLFDREPMIGGDNAHYMILAESIGTGQGYRDIHIPSAPNHAQYPPFYPLVLAAVGALGGSLIAFKIVSMFLTTASVVSLYLLARMRLGWTGALAVAAPLAVSPVLLDHSHWVLSEALFLLCVLVALAAAERSTGTDRWFVASLIAGVLAFLTRFAGLPVLIALALPLAWHRDWRRLAVVTAVATVAVGGWWLWGWLGDAPGAGRYAEVVFLRDTYRPELGSIDVTELFRRAGSTAWAYLSDVLPDTLLGSAAAHRSPGWSTGGSVVVAILAALGWLRGVRRMRPTEWYAVGYAAVICAWPDDFATRRYLLPLLPIVVLLAVTGANSLVGRIPGRTPVWALPALGGALALLALPGDLAAVEQNRRCAELARQGQAQPCQPPGWRAFAEIARWVRENTPDDAIVVSRKPRLFYLLAGRRGNGFPFTTDEARMFRFLDEIGTDYVVVAGLSDTTARYLFPVIEAHPDRFPAVLRIGKSSQPTGYLLRYLPTGTARPPPG
ncbi:MAG: glycosyltransferase family 39 protein [Myxococcota bacterium]